MILEYLYTTESHEITAILCTLLIEVIWDNNYLQRCPHETRHLVRCQWHNDNLQWF